MMLLGELAAGGLNVCPQATGPLLSALAIVRAARRRIRWHRGGPQGVRGGAVQRADHRRLRPPAVD